MTTRESSGPLDGSPESSESDAHEEQDALVRRLRSRVEELEHIIEMFDHTGELARLERLDSDRIIKAQKNLQSLAEQERREADAIIAAHERVHALSDYERMESARLAGSDTPRRAVEEAAANEIKRRDAVLAAILSMNANMSFSQLAADLFIRALNDTMCLMDAQRGFIARHGSSNMRIVVEKGYGSLLDDDAVHVLERLRANETVPGMHATIACDGRVYGLLYIERVPGKDAFSATESGFLEVLASQLSVRFGYILLRERFQQKDLDLRQVITHRDKFIKALSKAFSAELQQPMDAIIRLLGKGTRQGGKDALAIAVQFKKGIDKIMSIISQQQEIDAIRSYSIQIDKIVRKIINTFQQELEKRKLEVEYAFPEGGLTSFSGNYDTVYTILDEVICNAVVYNRVGGKVYIAIEQEDRVCRVLVRDTGIGMNEEMIPKVFERFYRAPGSNAMHTRGAGLGLFIVREFIESYGGSITLTSEEGKGSEVILSFPVWRTG